MPNIKIYVGDTVAAQSRQKLAQALQNLRDMVVRDLSVTPQACQLAIIEVTGMPGQPDVNVEMHLMPKADRTRDLLTEFAGKVRDLVADATGGHVAVRVMMLDPDTYIALK